MENNSNWKTGKIVVAVVLILVLGGVAIVSILRDRIVNQPQNQVSVVGQGRISYQPDIAVVTLGAQVDKVGKAEDALNQLNDKMNKIVSAVKAQGVAPEDIHVQSYTLTPQYDYFNNVSNLSGYNANQQLIIKVRDVKDKTDVVGKVISEAAKAGSNQILGVSFDVSNLEDLKQEARLKAIADAKSRASKISGVAGVRLGEIIGWWENVVQVPGTTSIYDASGKGGMGGGLISPTMPNGSQEVIIEMNLNYRVK